MGLAADVTLQVRLIVINVPGTAEAGIGDEHDFPMAGRRLYLSDTWSRQESRQNVNDLIDQIDSVPASVDEPRLSPSVIAVFSNKGKMT